MTNNQMNKIITLLLISSLVVIMGCPETILIPPYFYLNTINGHLSMSNNITYIFPFIENITGCVYHNNTKFQLISLDFLNYSIIIKTSNLQNNISDAQFISLDFYSDVLEEIIVERSYNKESNIIPFNDPKWLHGIKEIVYEYTKTTSETEQYCINEYITDYYNFFIIYEDSDFINGYWSNELLKINLSNNRGILLLNFIKKSESVTHIVKTCHDSDSENNIKIGLAGIAVIIGGGALVFFGFYCCSHIISYIRNRKRLEYLNLN